MSLNVQAGLDYLTTSGRSGQVFAVWDKLSALVDHYSSIGHKTHHLKMRGYSGYKVGDLAVFDSGEWSFIQAEGEASEVLFEASQGHDIRCTRIDLHATFVLTPETSDDTCGELVYKTAKASTDAPTPTRLQRGNGDSVYVGSRSSSRMLRVYRKDAQDPDAGHKRHTWRYELELKKPRSQVVYGSLAQIKPSDRPPHIVEYIRDYCDRRSIFCPFTQADYHGVVDTVSRKKTPIERKLDWLATSVSPSVRLIIESGYTEDLLKALGIAASPIAARHILLALKSLGHSVK